MKTSNVSTAAGVRRRAVHAIRTASLAALAGLALSACALAPGMRMGDHPFVQELRATRAPDAAPGIARADAPAHPADDGAPARADASPARLPVPIVQIDPQLIQRQRAEKAAATAALSALDAPAASRYRIGPGDVLQITVWDHPELAAAQPGSPQTPPRAADPVAGFVVDDRGNLTFPYAGKLKVAGLSAADAQARVTQALARVYRDPQVTLRVASYRSQQVYIDGEVHAPGAQAVNDVPMTLADALARAGGFTPAADQSDVTLVRDGVPVRIDVAKMIREHRNPADIVLRGGDLLKIAARDDNGVYVMGEVNRPLRALPKRNGRLTLGDALLQAGSINSNTADAAQMFVIRGDARGTPTVFHLDARSPVAMVLANEFELEPNDTVYVDGNGLVRFSRVLALLLPSVNTGAAAALATK
ncbi:polysaccharide biosynthesis/export family protein [Burkholderia semiarida]|uniref:polysaccharide biosynthesis/export family protein n=1 Tax=Burkholderia TaxID=32008 RepID=UPI00265DE784|nr:polysaccharide biosynthesis/export family protein [Burkholderia sp. AU44665]MDN7698531.1 polysaccharide biosynthesis/export family protein [Burkholderia sp. AU44665]